MLGDHDGLPRWVRPTRLLCLSLGHPGKCLSSKVQIFDSVRVRSANRCKVDTFLYISSVRCRCFAEVVAIDLIRASDSETSCRERRTAGLWDSRADGADGPICTSTVLAHIKSSVGKANTGLRSPDPTRCTGRFCSRSHRCTVRTPRSRKVAISFQEFSRPADWRAAIFVNETVVSCTVIFLPTND